MKCQLRGLMVALQLPAEGATGTHCWRHGGCHTPEQLQSHRVMEGNLVHVLNKAHQAYSSFSLTLSWEDTGQGMMVLHSNLENCQEKPLFPG